MRILAPIAVGTLTGASFVGVGALGLNEYGEFKERQQEAQLEDARQNRAEEVETYFGDMPHLEVDYHIGRNATLDSISVELVPENLESLDPEIAERVSLASAEIYVQRSTADGTQINPHGSGFLLEDENGEVSFVTAGHAFEDLQVSDLRIYTDDLKPINLSSVFASYSNGKSGQDHEDIAIGTLSEPEPFRDRALKARDLEANPLHPGEQLFLTNYQDGRHRGDEILYTMMYVGEFDDSDDRFIGLLGDITQGQEEDEIRPGASGGVVTDKNGDVVGVSVSTKEDNYNCDEGVLLWAEPGMFDRRYETPFNVQIPTNDECDNGLSLGVARTTKDIFDLD